MPLVAARALPMRNAVMMVRSVLMPRRAATSGSWAVARIARPMDVFKTNQAKSPMSSAETPTMKMSDHNTTAPPTSNATPLTISGKDWSAVPNRY